jgi:hypothetical protein
MATKKRKPAITGLSRPQGIIDDIIEVGADVVRRKTRDMAQHHIASGKRMRKEAKRIGKNEKILNSKLRDPLAMGTVNDIRKKSINSYSELKSWQDSRRKMRELIADAKGTRSVPTKASEARRAREGKQLKKKTGLPIKTARQKYYGEYNK